MLKCSDCKLQFKYASNLNEHRIYKHETDRNFQCETCNKFYKTAKDLKAHSRNHSTVNLFLCESCAESFKRRDTLRKHQLRHGNLIAVELVKTGGSQNENVDEVIVNQIKKSASDIKECVLDNLKGEVMSQENEHHKKEEEGAVSL